MGELGTTPRNARPPHSGRLPTGDDEVDEWLRRWDRGWLEGEGVPGDLDQKLAGAALDEDWEELEKFDAATGYQASLHLPEIFKDLPSRQGL